MDKARDASELSPRRIQNCRKYSWQNNDQSINKPAHRHFPMRDFIVTHFEHVLCGLILVSRIGDIGSTFLATPKLKLEANPIMRKLGWRFAPLTLFLCFIPYFSTNLGILVLVPFLFVSASNTGKIWFARAYGETEYQDLLLRMAGKSKLSHALAGTIVSAAFVALSGLVLLFLSPSPERDWGFWFAGGILLYAFIVAFYGSLFFLRLFKKARSGESD
jgi:hypothetical protein